LCFRPHSPHVVSASEKLDANENTTSRFGPHALQFRVSQATRIGSLSLITASGRPALWSSSPSIRRRALSVICSFALSPHPAHIEFLGSEIVEDDEVTVSKKLRRAPGPAADLKEYRKI